jgi:hypothetical protein
MPGVVVTSRRIWEGSDPEPLARVVGRDEAALQQSDVTSINFRIFEINATTAIYEELAIDPGSGQPGGGAVIFNTLQTDGRWKADTQGYNFRYAVRQADLATQSAVLEGGKTYVFEFLLTTTAWGVIPVVFEYEVVPLYSS